MAHQQEGAVGSLDHAHGTDAERGRQPAHDETSGADGQAPVHPEWQELQLAQHPPSVRPRLLGERRNPGRLS
jgi:hypothetical protein